MLAANAPRPDTSLLLLFLPTVLHSQLFYVCRRTATRDLIMRNATTVAAGTSHVTQSPRVQGAKHHARPTTTCSCLLTQCGEAGPPRSHRLVLRSGGRWPLGACHTPPAPLALPARVISTAASVCPDTLPAVVVPASAPPAPPPVCRHCVPSAPHAGRYDRPSYDHRGDEPRDQYKDDDRTDKMPDSPGLDYYKYMGESRDELREVSVLLCCASLSRSA